MTTVNRISLTGTSLAVAAIAFVLIRGAMLPGLGFWDTGEFQTVGPLLGTAHPTGFPAYVILGWLGSVVLQPFGEPALRMNLLSTLLVASAAGVTVVLVRLVTGVTALGVAAGIGVATAPIAWRIGTRADPHALHLVLVALLAICLVAWEREHRRDGRDRWLLAASVVYGVSLANHSLTVLLAVPIALFVLAVDRGIVRRFRLVTMCALIVVATAAVLYLELPLRAGPFRAPLVYGTPNTLDGFRYIVLAEQFQGSIVDPFGDLGTKLAALVDLAVQQFGILAPLIPVGFVATVVRAPRYALLSGVATLITCFFAASYANADISRYYLGPLLFVWTWLAMLAATALAAVALLPAAQLSSAAPLSPTDTPGGLGGSASAVAAVVLAALLLVPTLLEVPTRANAVDASHDDQARRWVDDVVEILPPNAVVVSWWSYSTPLWYVQRVERRRPDITIVDDRTRLDEQLGEISDVIDAHLGREPVYLIARADEQMPLLEARYRLDLQPGLGGTLFRVAGPAGSAQ